MNYDSVHIYIYIYICYICIRRPMLVRGHQAAKGMLSINVRRSSSQAVCNSQFTNLMLLLLSVIVSLLI